MISFYPGPSRVYDEIPLYVKDAFKAGIMSINHRSDEFVQVAGSPGARAFGVYLKCFERGLLIRTTGDIIALSPALIFENRHIEELVGILGAALKDSA